MAHVRTPYQCSNRDFRNEEHPHHWHITGDHRDGDDSDDPIPTCVSVAIVVGNETSAPITEDTAKFLVRAANCHDELVAACETVMQWLSARASHYHGLGSHGVAADMAIRADVLKRAIAKAHGTQPKEV